MALVPTHQLYARTTSFIDSFPSSLVTKCHFFRYASSIPLKNESFYANINNINSSKLNHLNPEKRFNFLLRKKKKTLGFTANRININNASFSSISSKSGKRSSWLHKWNETHKGNKLKRPREVLNYRNSGYVSTSDCEDNNGSRTDVSGSTMERIIEKLKKFGFNEDVSVRTEEGRTVIEKGSIEDIFYVEEELLPNSRGGFSEESPLGDDNVFRSGGQVSFPWERPEEVNEEERKYSVRQKSRSSLAQLTLPESELRRLRNLALRIKSKMKVGGAGVTKEIVERIHEKWKTSEVARLKIEGPPALNMKRMHEILERKTGGLVIWRSGTSVTLYRGVSYVVPFERPNKRIYKKDDIPHHLSRTADDGSSEDALEHSHLNCPQDSPAESLSSGEKYKNLEALPEVRYEDEVDKLLDGLGPRYTDWPGSGPLPIDADLLPGVVRGYQPPFRLLPYGVRSTLGMKEGTALRRLARVLPPHFALGRSRQHQGLAAAMIKIWERSSVVKIAVKRGVQLTTSERMAEDIKKLTGGMLLSRNKDFLVFYRGKDFLSPDIAKLLLEKETLAKSLQDEEEQARLRASASVTRSVGRTDALGTTAGTLGETLDADARWGKRLDDDDREKVMREADILRHTNLVRKLEKKLAFAERKIMKAEKALGKVEESLNPADQPADPHSITDEERFMFRKLGLRMKAFLLLGRRGVFDGTVENMHLHWKYRELVKIMVKAKNFEQVKNIALSLEAESGGVLVSVDKVSKGYAIIVFRGKDYKRPSTLRPRNLLTKRKALARSIELQRRQALLHHISTLQTRMNQLRSEIEQMAAVKDRGDEELYDKLDSAYLTEDEDSEEEGEEEFLEIYVSNNDAIDGSNTSIDGASTPTNFPYEFHEQPEVKQL